ncbi:MAG: TonB-dependent receptor [Tannerellaceae bacterium]|nr:TonB-dependent receptor [Tannerellaceae bacterium]MCD8263735.1 TonB-dependent receptor [Tannerellaceae bacterium]
MAALLGCSLLAVAQENNTNDPDLNRELTLEREYDPSVQDASKVNTLPEVKEPEVNKRPIDYAGYVAPAHPDKEITLLPSGKIMTDIQYNKRRGYFNFAGGTYLNLNSDLGYHILDTEKDKLNFFVSHRSTNGNVKYLLNDEKVKAKLNDNLAGINFRHEFDRMALKVGAKYGYTSFNYYGQPVTSLESPYFGLQSSISIPDSLDTSTNQVNQTIKIHAGIESGKEAQVGYLLDIDFTNFSQKYGPGINYDGIKENNFGLKGGMFANFSDDNQQVGVAGLLNYYNYSTPDIFSDFFENYAEITITPYYRIKGDTWKVQLGLNAMLITGDQSKFFVSPNITANAEVAEKTVLYLNADGKIESNSAEHLAQLNRYYNPMAQVAASRTWLDATVGLKSGVGLGFWFNLFAGYKITDNDVFFYQSLPHYNHKDVIWGNVSEAAIVNSKLFRAGLELKYQYQKLFDFFVKGVYNNWNVEDDYKAYGKPKVEFGAGVTVKPIDPFSFTIDYQLATDRYTTVLPYQEIKMDNISELNITGSYAFNDIFGAYVKLNNVLFQKYELLYGYPCQGFNFMVGVNINF